MSPEFFPPMQRALRKGQARVKTDVVLDALFLPVASNKMPNFFAQYKHDKAVEQHDRKVEQVQHKTECNVLQKYT